MSRILYVCHNHPFFHPGGTEIFARDLSLEMKSRGHETFFLGCANRLQREQKPGTVFQTVGRSSDEMVIWTGHFDRFNMSQIDLYGVFPEFKALLENFRPDVVHFHHTLLIGVEAVSLVRRILPDCRIVYTLHDFYHICANEGQMVKTKDGGGGLCLRASPDACRKCFPERTQDKFVLREKHIKNMLSAVDVFASPSEFLKRRYVEWGLPESVVKVVANGRPTTDAAPYRPIREGGIRNSFAYFGNLSPFKGTSVLFSAVSEMLSSGVPEFRMSVHGGAPFQTDEFNKSISEAIERCGASVIATGRYEASDVPLLMRQADWVVMPSIWWENVPLVIQEAFQHRRPVICSGIGGMAEMVSDGVNGIHFKVGDHRSLAEAMMRAMTEPGLWEKLTSGIPPSRTVEHSADQYETLYFQNKSA